MQNKAPIRQPHKEGIYDEFITWFSSPYILRRDTGILDQNAFSKRYGVSEDTLSRWKKRRDFDSRVTALRDEWGHEKTSDIMDAIYRSAVKGNAKSQRLWMQYFSGFDLKKIKEENAKQKYLTISEVHSLIEGLPGWLKKKYNDCMRDLAYDATLFIEEGRTMTEEEYREMNKDGL